MPRILHCCNLFDPSASVIRAVTELQKYSKFEHELLIWKPHPLQETYQFEEPRRFAQDLSLEERQACFDRADAVLYHFLGWESGCCLLKQPCAFRNINIYWSGQEDKFWSAVHYNALPPYSHYKFLASSHVGAQQFLGEPFRWLPDLIDIAAEKYLPDWSPREPCVSYAKHSEFFESMDFGAKHLNLWGTAHDELLRQRKHNASVVIDNISDGHWGLAGNESMALALPTVVFNHGVTLKALREFTGDEGPFFNVGPSLTKAMEKARELAGSELLELRCQIRNWVDHWMHPQVLIERFWEPAFTHLLS